MRQNVFVLKSFCIFSKDDSVLVYKGRDSFTGKEFYRFIGGKVEFGETSLEAVQREVLEETGRKLSGPTLVKTLENIFTYNGRLNHEVDFVYDGRLEGIDYGRGSEIECNDDGRVFTATWKTREELLKDARPLLPWNPFEALPLKA